MQKPVDPEVEKTRDDPCVFERTQVNGTRSADRIKASGRTRRINRPHTWPHPTSLHQRRFWSCQKGAVHTWANTTLGNVKNSLRGTYHAIRPKHTPRYLAQFVYRFNRRYRLDEMIPRLAWAALRTPPMPYNLLNLAEQVGNQEVLDAEGAEH